MGRPKVPAGHGNPTALQREAWETVERLGTQKAACAELDVRQAALQGRMAGYQHAMGLTGPLPGVKVYGPRVARGTGLTATLRATIASLEADVERLTMLRAEDTAEIHALQERIVALEADARPWVAIHAKLDALAARPSGTVIFQPSHRRVADGGQPVREQRKAARKAVA